MSQFSYRARTPQGELLEGIVQAASLDEAGRQLRNEGKFVVALSPAQGGRGGGTARAAGGAEAADAGTGAGVANLSIRLGTGVRRDEVVSFTHRLALMMETGVPVTEALNSVAEQCANPHLAKILRDIESHVSGGGTLSEALNRHHKVFPPLMVSLVAASEVSGTMSTMLGRISQYLDKQQRMTRKVRGALTYPAVLMALVVAAIIFLLTFLMPQFTVIYADRGAALPGPTRALMATSDFLVTWWMLWVPALVMLPVAVALALRTDPGRWVWHTLSVHLPVIGPMMRKLYLARACQAMATLIHAGVPVLDMVAAARQVTPNVHFQRFWDRADEQLRRGGQLSSVMAGSEMIPVDVTQMVQAGEKAGRLGKVLERVGEHGEEAFDAQVQQATQLIEPAMIVVMGALIGFIALAMLLPIFRISSVIAG